MNGPLMVTLIVIIILIAQNLFLPLFRLFFHCISFVSIISFTSLFQLIFDTYTFIYHTRSHYWYKPSLEIFSYSNLSCIFILFLLSFPIRHGRCYCSSPVTDRYQFTNFFTGNPCIFCLKCYNKAHGSIAQLG